MQIKELETEVGLPLFDRETRQVQLTLTGEYLLTYARRVLAELKDAQDMVATLRKLEGGDLVIGMVSSAQQFLPALMGEFRAEHREVSLRLRVGNREQLAAWMRANELDLAVMGRPPREIATRAEPFATNPLVLVTAPDHPFVHMEQVSALRVSMETLLLREPGSGTRAALEEYLREHHLHSGPTMELPSNETIKHAVMAGPRCQPDVAALARARTAARCGRHARGRGPADPAPLVPREEPRQDAERRRPRRFATSCSSRHKRACSAWRARAPCRLKDAAAILRVDDADEHDER